MTILVTGGAGYIGSHMAHALADAGVPAVVLDDLSTGFDWAVPERVPLVFGDCGDEGLVASLIATHDIDAIIHFAGSLIVSDSVGAPLDYYRNNTMNSHRLIETAIKFGVRHFIYSSSAAVYGNPAHVPVGEDEPKAPVSPYGCSKLMTEIMLKDAGRAHGLSYAILRYFNVAGAEPQLRTGESTRNSTHLVKIAAQTALGVRPSMTIFGSDYPTPDGTCIRDYIHVSDLASAHAAALTYLRQGGQPVTLNCGYGRGFSVREVIETVKRVAGVDFRVARGSRRSGDPAAVVANADRIMSLTGWRPRYNDLATIAGHALAWERKLMAMQIRRSTA